MAQSAIVESIGTEGDSSVKPEVKEEAESLEEEDPETLSGIGGADQPVGYIIHFANTVKVYQKKNNEKGRPDPQKPVVTQLASPDKAPRA